MMMQSQSTKLPKGTQFVVDVERRRIQHTVHRRHKRLQMAWTLAAWVVATTTILSAVALLWHHA